MDWVTPFLTYMWEHGYQRFDVDAAAEAGWCDHVKDMYQGLLLRNAKSWFTGYNSNVKGHEYGTMRYNVYNGGGPRYARMLSEVTQNGYTGISFQ